MDKNNKKETKKIRGAYDHLKQDTSKLRTKRRSSSKIMVIFIASLLVFSTLLFSGVLVDNSPTDEDPEQHWNEFSGDAEFDILLFSSPDCGCCEEYIPYLEENGYTVDFRKTEALTSLKDDLSIPDESRSCHTAKYGNYFVEGHVPIDAINKLLSQQSEIDGIALPGMPSGSPGMPGEKDSTFVIQSIVNGEVVDTFMEI